MKRRVFARRRQLVTFLLICGLLLSLWYIFGSAHHIEQLDRVVSDSKQTRLSSPGKLHTAASNNNVSNQSRIYNYFDLPLTTDSCQVIHIAIVVAGYNTSRDVVVLIKSILFYRRSPLHFHFITDQIARHILNTLFHSWQLPSVNTSYYKVDDYAARVTMIDNAHYSGVYGLMKLVLPEALPVSLSQVIVLDTDLTFTTDVTLLWRIMSKMKGLSKLLGLVENQSDWYLGTLWRNYKVWPAIGRGFNTGVMLMDLTGLRSINWYHTWNSIAMRVLKVKQSTPLADQDIINAVIKHYPDIHYIIPCYWNVQLSEHSLSEDCYHGEHQYKRFHYILYVLLMEVTWGQVIHWNSPLKTHVDIKHVEHFRHLHNIFMQLDGSQLRSPLLFCGQHDDVTSNISSKVNNSDHCWQFTQHTTLYRTHPYFIHYNYKQPAGHTDVTLVAQLSHDRLHMLEALCDHWEGPISLSLYLTDPEASHFLQLATSSPVISHRTNIAFHVVYKSINDAGFYPVNYMRNVALRHANTQYVFLSDIDFLPSYGLHDYLKGLVKDEISERKIFVIPAFETLRYRLEFPSDKLSLLRMLDEGTLYTFRYHVWKRGHSATDYAKWRTAVNPYKVEWSPDYEPYIVVRSDVPLYDTQFVGFGWNKVSHIMRLDAMGYQFHVIPDHFIIHIPHSPSLDISMFRSNPHYRQCLQRIKNQFQRNLVKEFGSDAFKYLTR
ncbi:xylosyl- and glucuronyltransferase LARGE2s-like [Dysidea avara]|uniref:xylosyl- and glucuronyltransferase LARGE2s-like n=1 Tax=Dysidea avara TaxID=196820 RepID=UPI00332374CC